uniref:Uncharacterized protein n=1 Tax=Sipha flava TaxID=143950 RepID=A0A2S2R8I5_9HEMI
MYSHMKRERESNRNLFFNHDKAKLLEKKKKKRRFVRFHETHTKPRLRQYYDVKRVRRSDTSRGWLRTRGGDTIAAKPTRWVTVVDNRSDGQLGRAVDVDKGCPVTQCQSCGTTETFQR